MRRISQIPTRLVLAGALAALAATAACNDTDTCPAGEVEAQCAHAASASASPPGSTHRIRIRAPRASKAVPPAPAPGKPPKKRKVLWTFDAWWESTGGASISLKVAGNVPATYYRGGTTTPHWHFETTKIPPQGPVRLTVTPSRLSAQYGLVRCRIRRSDVVRDLDWRELAPASNAVSCRWPRRGIP